LLSLHFRLDSKTDIYKRNVYDLTRWIVDFSGISKAFYYIGLATVQFIALRLYKSDLITELFMLS
jgi:hypothetical protein